MHNDKFKILIGEKNPIDQRVLANMVLVNGHTPAIFASTTREILDAMEDDAVDLALIDWELASAEAFHVLREVKSKGVTTPVLIMVPGMENGLIASAMEYGFSSFIPRPIPMHKLNELIVETAQSAPVEDTTLAPSNAGGAPPAAGPPAPQAAQAPAPSGKGAPSVAPITSATGKRPDAQAKELFAEGRRLLREKQFQAATTCFLGALERRALFPEAILGLALANKGLKSLDKARRLFNKATESYVRASRFEEAAKLFSELRKNDSEVLNPFRVVADALSMHRQHEQALCYYEKASAIDPADPMVCYALARAYHKLERKADASLALDRFLSTNLSLLGRIDLSWAEKYYQRLNGAPWRADGGQNPEANPKAANLKVLIVDDEPHLRLLLERSLEPLEQEGVSLLFAEDGEQGLAMIRSENPNLVFLDVMMPKRNGFDVCCTVKQELRMTDVYIVMLTAKGQEFDRQRGREVGADVYMTKPFRPAQILNLAKAVLDI
jgi:pentatricopeptide repeat protein